MSYSAALDACAIMFILDDVIPQDPVEARRWQNVRATMRSLSDSGANLVIPAPVLTECGAHDSGVGVAEAIAKRIARVEVPPFDAEAAELAGDIARSMFAARAASGGGVPGRHILKFDAMIFATAIRWGARKLITTNERDFERLLKHTKKTIEIVRADDAVGQVTILGSR